MRNDVKPVPPMPRDESIVPLADAEPASETAHQHDPTPHYPGASRPPADVSHSSDRTSSTTGRLGNRDHERSARMAAMADTNALPTARDATSYGVPILMAAIVLLLALCLLWAFGAFTTNDPNPSDQPTLGTLNREKLSE